MKYLPFIIIPFAVSLIMPIAAAFIMKNNRRKEEKSEKIKIVMRASKSFGFSLTALTFILAVIIAVLNIYDELDLVANIILCLVWAFLIFGRIQSFRQKLVIIGGDIFYTPTIGKSKRYKFEDIKKVIEVYYSQGLIQYKVFDNSKKIFVFSNYALESNLLLQLFKEKGIS
jgi:hypothetical protein